MHTNLHRLLKGMGPEMTTQLYDARDTLELAAKKAYKELREVYTSEGPKWKKLDEEDQDYYRTIVAMSFNALADIIRERNDDLSTEFPVGSLVGELEKMAAQR